MEKTKNPFIKWEVSAIDIDSISTHVKQPEFTAELVGCVNSNWTGRTVSYTMEEIYQELDAFLRPEKHQIYPAKVIYNGPATIVFWSDGDKTVVRCGDQDFYDNEKGFVMAYLKKLIGNKALKQVLETWVWDKMDPYAECTVLEGNAR